MPGRPRPPAGTASPRRTPCRARRRSTASRGCRPRSCAPGRARAGRAVHPDVRVTRSSHGTNATRASAPTTSAATTTGDPHPSRSCSMSPSTTPPTPTTASTAPTTSTGHAARDDVGRDPPDERDRDRDRHRRHDEDPPPADAVHDQAAHDRAEDRRRARPRRPRADRLRLRRPAERRDDERQRTRGDQRTADALERASDDEDLAGGCDGTATEAMPKTTSPHVMMRTRPNRSDNEPATRISEPSVTR